MKDNRLASSLLTGIIVILIIAGISLLSKLNSASDLYKKELAKNMDIQRESEILRQENTQLKTESATLKEQTVNLNDVLDKLRKDMVHLEMVNEKMQTAIQEAHPPESAAPAVKADQPAIVAPVSAGK